MILLNKKLPDGQIIPIIHKGANPDRVGEIMTLEEIHQFGIDLLIAYLHKQNGKFIGVNGNIGSHYPHLIVKNPSGELLYVWVKTEIYPTIPDSKSLENKEEVYKLSKQFNATPVFAGVILKYITTEFCNPIYGGNYIAEFTSLKSLNSRQS